MVEASLDADIDGHEAFNLAAAENYPGRPTTEVIKRMYDDLPDDCGLNEEISVYSTEKASDLLDWAPEHEWRTTAEETISWLTLTAD